jgi:hypothetical protein
MGGRQANANNSELNIGNSVNRNQALLNNEDQEANIVVGQPKMKKTIAIKNPVYLKRNSLIFEKDSTSINKYYIKFIYDSLVDFDLNIILFAKMNKPNSTKLFSTIESSNNNHPNLTFFCEKGYKVNYLDQKCFINADLLKDVEFGSIGCYDLVLEMIPRIESTEPIGFYTLCTITDDNSSGNRILKVKAVSQRLRAQGMLMEVNEIFNSMRETGECIICYEKNANTILLPCKHSCCSSCAHGLRMRNLGCPICKQSK